MNLSFLILAHKNPDQLQLLVNYLLEQDCRVYIHVDKKSESRFESFFKKNDNRANLHCFCKYKVYWGSFNQIEATFFLLREALKLPFDFVNLISGQDLPIRSLSDFKSFLLESRNYSFIEFNALPDPENMEGEGGLERVKYHWITDFAPSFGFFFNKLNVILHFLQKRTGLVKKWGIDLFAGPNWFTINREAAEYAADYVDKNVSFYTKFRNTRLADEIILQTILRSNPGLLIKNESLRYVDWKTGPEFPRTFRMEDLEKLKSSGCFFARKFDENVDIGIINKIYANI